LKLRLYDFAPNAVEKPMKKVTMPAKIMLSSVIAIFWLGFSCAAHVQTISVDDTVRVAEFYRLAPQIEDNIWPGWSKVVDPLLLITPTAEFLTHFPSPPKEFKPTNDGFLTRPRQFPPSLQATFPAFGPPSVIAIGQPSLTASKTSTPWEIVVMHEHFHQLQNAQAGYSQAVAALGLSHGDQTGMWMLNYPFPYTNAGVVRTFAELRDQLLLTSAHRTEGSFVRPLNAI
jgi:hypothetical protein